MGADQKVAEEKEQAERKTPARSTSRARKPRQARPTANHDAGRDADHDINGGNPANADHDGQRKPVRRRQRSDGHLNAFRAAKLGLTQIVDLTGKEPAGVAAVERSEDGWTVGVEVIEDRRIPSSTDVLALYQADLAADGELVGYHRVRRYRRGQGDTDSGSESW